MALGPLGFARIKKCKHCQHCIVRPSAKAPRQERCGYGKAECVLFDIADGAATNCPIGAWDVVEPLRAFTEEERAERQKRIEEKLYGPLVRILLAGVEGADERLLNAVREGKIGARAANTLAQELVDARNRGTVPPSGTHGPRSGSSTHGS